MVLEFTVPGRPVPWQRTTTVKVGKSIRRLTPTRTREYAEHVRNCARAVMPMMGWPKGCRYAVHIDAHIAPTKKGEPRKQDIDNILKGVLDGLNGVLWHDDCQVDAVSARRWNDDNERVVVRVTVETGDK